MRAMTSVRPFIVASVLVCGCTSGPNPAAGCGAGGAGRLAASAQRAGCRRCAGNGRDRRAARQPRWRDRAAPRRQRRRRRCRDRVRARGTLPSAGNVGGGGFAVMSVNGQTAALDFRETAPAAASRTCFSTDTARRRTARSPATSRPACRAASRGCGPCTRSSARNRGRSSSRRRSISPNRALRVDADFSSAVGDEAARLAKFPASAALFLPGGTQPADGSHLEEP